MQGILSVFESIGSHIFQQIEFFILDYIERHVDSFGNNSIRNSFNVCIGKFKRPAIDSHQIEIYSFVRCSKFKSLS